MGQNLYDLIWFNLQVGVEQTGEEQNFLSLGRKTTNIMWYAEQRDNQPMSNSTDITWYGNPNTEYQIWKSKYGIWNMEIPIWNMNYGKPNIWNMKYGNPNMDYEIWKSEHSSEYFKQLDQTKDLWGKCKQTQISNKLTKLGLLYKLSIVYKAHAHCIKS